MTHASPLLPRLLKIGGNEAIVCDVASGDSHYPKPLTLTLYQTCRDHTGYTLSVIAAALATRLRSLQTATQRPDGKARIGLLGSA